MSVPAEERMAEAGRWLRFAEEDLRVAESGTHEAPLALRHLCTFAQQAAEKSMKAALVSLDVDPPRTHNLQLLADLLPEDWHVSDMSVDFAALSVWAVESRYPGDWPEPTDVDVVKCVSEARQVFDAVVARLEFARGAG